MLLPHDEENIPPERISKKHKALRQDGRIVSQAQVDKIRILLFKGMKHKSTIFSPIMDIDALTYDLVKDVVGDEASKVLKCLVDEGFIEKIECPKDKIITICVNKMAKQVIFKNGKWLEFRSELDSIRHPKKVNKSMRKYYEHTRWNSGWYLKVSEISSKAKRQLKINSAKDVEVIEWDGIGYNLVKGDAYQKHGVRLGFITKQQTNNFCPNCGKELPFKGRHNIYNRGHKHNECRILLIEKVLNE